MSPLPRRDHQLRCFVAVAKARSLRLAAEILVVTQPALSKQIRALEAAVGHPLFRRHGRGMELTADGDALFHRVEPLFVAMDAALSVAAPEGGPPRDLHGAVRVAAVQTLVPVFLPRWSTAVLAAAPLARLSFQCTSSADVVESVERDKADVGFVYDTAVDAPDLVGEHILDEGMALYATKMPAPDADRLAFIAAQHLVLPPRQYALRRMVDRAFGRLATVPLECDSMELCLHLVATGAFVTVLPDHLPLAMVEARGIARMPLPDLPQRRIVALTKGRPRPRTLLELAVRLAREIGAAP